MEKITPKRKETSGTNLDVNWLIDDDSNTNNPENMYLSPG